MRLLPRLLILLSLVLSGCSASEQVMNDGPFQKRKYRPGWHVDLGWNDPRPSPTRDHLREVAPQRMAPRIAQPSAGSMPALEASSTPLAPAPIATRKPRSSTPPVILQAPRVEPATATPTTEGAATTRRWNRMALISGVFLTLAALVIGISGGGEVLIYLLVFALLTGIIGLILAIKHKERGKGIAIAAIAGSLTVLSLLIAAIASGW